MFILGLTTMGDAAAALIYNGEVVAAAEEERFSRIKHHIGFPHNAIRYCLDTAGITLKDVAHVGLYWKPWIIARRAWVALTSMRTSGAMFVAKMHRGAEQVSGSYLKMFRLPKYLRENFGDSDFKFHYVEHHLCHAASCFLVSPFDTAAILTIDGTGEDTTTMLAHGVGLDLKVLHRIKLPHSLGQFYSAITNFLGFDMYEGDEWKVMGLAAYGQPEFLRFFRENVLQMGGKADFKLNVSVLDHHLAKRYVFPDDFVRACGPFRQSGEEINERHKNIAASAQKLLEEVGLHLVEHLRLKTGERNLCLAGGVAFNSVMNGRIMQESGFDNYYVQPAAGDAGCALGAAYYIYHSKLRFPRRYVMRNAYLGPSFSSKQCEQVLEQNPVCYERLTKDLLVKRTANLLSEGSIVAWFQGRMEWGPRALGARSFLADPRIQNMRELLNRKVKLREWFRPLAPSILEEQSEWIFGTRRNDPFMITVFPVLPERRCVVPAITHVDGTARPQTVSKQTNPLYWELIKEFANITGVPALLNTSFNIQEPIVCTPQDAVSTFLRSQVDYLVMEDFIVWRN
jgi:carbamoyltransferase